MPPIYRLIHILKRPALHGCGEPKGPETEGRPVRAVPLPAPHSAIYPNWVDGSLVIGANLFGYSDIRL